MPTVLTLCAHNDDQIVGAGGTLVKYRKKGWRVRTVIFSPGEMSHPHIKKEEIVKRRMKEAKASDVILGGNGFICLDVQDQKFEESIKKKNIAKKLTTIIKKEKPELVLTHSKDDIHPDHRAVHRLIKSLVKKKVITCPVYTFDVWTPFGIAQAKAPRLYVDISDTFGTKLKAFFAHKSQIVTVFQLVWSIYLRAIINGWKIRKKYAEVFYKL